MVMGPRSESLIPTESCGISKITDVRETESRQVVTPTRWRFQFWEERASTEVRQSADLSELPMTPVVDRTLGTHDLDNQTRGGLI